MTTVIQQNQTDFTLPIHNEEALKQLRKEIELVSGEALMAGTAAAVAGAFINPAALLLLLGVYPPLIRGEKSVRLEQTTALLLDHFADQGIQVFPVQGVDRSQGISQSNPIDLFVRFPRRAHLFISIRSRGNSEIIYHEAKEILQVKRKSKTGLVTWKPCPLVELSDYERWLNKNRGIFGMSSKEITRTPTAKVLVLWRPTKAAEDHNPHLYSEMGDVKLLALRRKGTTFVIQEDELINFVQLWLVKYE